LRIQIAERGHEIVDRADTDYTAALRAAHNPRGVTVRVTDENYRPAGREDAIEFAGHDQSLQRGQ
jgi:hypothetical protein